MNDEIKITVFVDSIDKTITLTHPKITGIILNGKPIWADKKHWSVGERE